MVSWTDKGLCAFPNGPGPSSLENSYIASLVLQAIFLPTAPFPEGRDLSDQCNLTHGTLFTFPPLMGLNVRLTTVCLEAIQSDWASGV